MNFKSLVSLFLLAGGAGLSTVACAAAPEESEEPTEQAGEEIKASWTHCNHDSDCVAVDQGGCCEHGIKVAVNTSSTKAYADSVKCKNPPMACPLFMVLDTRVAQCDASAHKCKMFKPEEIRCGGFTTNPHACPTGYSCDLSGHVPDVPGVCKKNTPPPSTCTKNSDCGAGHQCSFCWGKMACIPNGAMC
jgi:hypothetical protein